MKKQSLLFAALTLVLGLLSHETKAQYTKLLDFVPFPATATGNQPNGDLYFDGVFMYGLAAAGGVNNMGTIYKIKPDGTGFAKIYDFDGVAHGRTPLGSLISDGTFLYGMTALGGANGFGVIFKIMPDGTGFVKLFDFTGTADGNGPRGSLLFDGTFLYGMSETGGATNVGSIFKIKTDGTGFVKLRDLVTATDGRRPLGSLITDGTFLYGVTQFGGGFNHGTIFKIKPDGTAFQVILSFNGTTDGADPTNSLLYDGAMLYGMGRAGGAGVGNIFKIATDGTGFTVLHNLITVPDGASPVGSLSTDGTNLYGFGQIGGTSGLGTVFTIKKDGTGFTKLVDFAGATTGAQPKGSLLYYAGSIYGQTTLGGASNGGVIFKYTLAGTPPAIASFTPSSGPVGTTITIAGSGFSATPANNIVYFGATQATATAATPTQLTVTVPIGATYQPISVTVAGSTAFSQTPFLVTFANGGAINACSFAPHVDFGAGNFFYGLTTGDLDGDGKSDMVVTDLDGTIEIYRNTSTVGSITSGSFAPSFTLAVNPSPYTVSLTDIDGDGKLDIITPSHDNSILSIFRNISTAGTLTAASFSPRVDFLTLPAGGFPYTVLAQDLDGDGKTDIAITNKNASFLSVWRNTSVVGSITSASLSPRVDIPFTGGSSGFAIADIDVDGKPDLVAGSFAGSALSVLRNISTPGVLNAGSFAPQVDFTVGFWVEYVAVGDLDNDQRPDIVTSSWPDGTMSILKNTSTPGTISAASFAPRVVFTGIGEARGLSITDLDGDGAPDIATAVQASVGIFVYKNITTSGIINSGSFAPRVVYATGGNSRGVVSGDIDGDGRPDLMVTNYNGPPVSVLRNTMAPTITSASPSSGYVGTTVTLTGTNFSLTLANNVVKFNGVTATISASTPTSITAKVPVGATSGPITIDVCGQPALGTVNFTVTTFAPSICNNITLNGTTDYVSVNDSPLLHPTSITVEGFVNFSTGGFRVIFSKAFGATNQFTYILYYDGGGALWFVFNPMGATFALFTPTPGRWYHMAIVYDNATLRQTLLVDGVAVASAPATVPIYDANPFDFGSALSFGSHGSFFNGKMTEARIWGTARTEAEIQSTINTSPVGNEAGLLAYYKMNETAQGTGVAIANSATATGAAINGVTVGTASTPVLGYTCSPTITSFTPVSGPVGTTVTIAGTGFSATPANNIVYFGATRATVTAATTTQLTVNVPVGATYQPITVTVAALSAFSKSPFLVTFPNGGLINACSFETPTFYGTGVGGMGLAIGDLDGDGKTDVVTTDYSDDKIHIFRNTSTLGTISATSFASSIDYAVGDTPQRAAIVDIDGDGKLDIIVTSYLSNIVSIFRNVSTPGSLTLTSFSARVDLLTNTGSAPLSIICQDLDGDGKTDIAVSNAAHGTISIWQNIGSPGVITTSSFATRLDIVGPSSGLTVGDIDVDGKPDLVGGYNGGTAIGVARNISTPGTLTAGSFSPFVNFTVGAWPENVIIGDLDNDNRPDIVTSSWPSNTISILKNISTPGTIAAGSLASVLTITGNGEPRGATITDFDGDGLPDIGLANQTSNFAIYRNANTPGTITSASFLPLVVFPGIGNARETTSGDIDGDGKPEVITTNFGAQSFAVMRNSIGATVGSLNPASGFIGTTITITGTNFSNTLTNNVVKFNGVTATIISATSTSLTVKVPAGATTGTVTVEVCGVVATGGTFTVNILSLNPCKVLSLNGTADFVSVNDDPSLRPLSFSVEAMVNFSSAPGLVIIVAKPFGAGSQDSYTIWYQGGSLLGGVNPSSPFGVPGIPWTPVVGQWYHVALTYDNTSLKQTLYLDGIAVASATGSTPVYDAQAFNIGSDVNFGSQGFFFNGKIEEVRLWNSVRTEAEIQSTISSELIGNESGLIAYYKLNESGSGAGITVLNSATSTGAIANGTTVGSASSPSFLNLCKPTISSFSPASGPIGTTVTINGSSFAATPANNIVFFGATRATVSAATTTQLTVIVPFGATYQPISATVAGRTAYSNIPFVVTFNDGGVINTCSFAPKFDYSSGGATPGDLSFGDLDGDGKADMVVTNFNSGNVSILRNTSTLGTIDGASFAANVTLAGVAGRSARGVALGDIDGDGKLDIVIANYGDNSFPGSISIFRNISTVGSISAASFAPRVDYPCSGAYTPAIKDLDGDGKPDIVVSSYFAGTIAVFHNTSTIGVIDATSLGPQVNFAAPPGGTLIDMAIADLDLDGKPDLITTNVSFNIISVFKNTTSTGIIDASSFAPRVDISTGIVPYYLAVGDLNHDSWPELIVANSGSATFSVFENTGTPGIINNATFTKTDFATAINPLGVSTNDLDGDGAPEIMITDLSTTVYVFKNLSTGSINSSSFAPSVSFPAVNIPYAIETGDLDGDGKPEFAFTNYFGGSISVMRNTVSNLPAPTVTSFPTSGAIGSTVTINGMNFSTTPLNNIVKFNGVVATVTAATSTSITTIVPVGATTGTISVTIGCNTITSGTNFTVGVTPPTITSFSPINGPVGTTVTITGTNFSPTPANNIVYFGATRASVTAATSTQLTVTVPIGATHQSITVSVNGLSAHASRPFIVTFSGGGSIDACSFAPGATIGTVPGSTRPALADIDGDGKPDLLIPESANNQLSIFRNTSTAGTIAPGSFATKVSFATVNTPFSVAVGDLDGDGLRDLAVINYRNQKLSLFKNQSVAGTISLATRVDMTIPDWAHDVSIADMDGDGKQDLVIATSLVGLTTYRNVGTPGVINTSTFAAGTNFTTGPNPNPFVLGDIDGDGKLDAAVPNGNAYTVSLLRNTSTPGTISFAANVVLTITSGTPVLGEGTTFTALGDIDGDTKLDLAATTNTVYTTSLYRNTSVPGTFSFDPKVDLSNTDYANTPSLGDLDGDGKIELITDYGTPNIAIYKNVSTPGSINASSFNAPFLIPRTTATTLMNGDIDGDGRNEILTASGPIQIFRNVIGAISVPTISNFTPVSATIGATVTITGTNFITPFTNSVTINGINAPITGATATSITVTVPVGASTGLIAITIGCNTVNSATNFTVTDLLAQYTFSGNANDASGNSNNGTVTGATLAFDPLCNPNQAYSFDGNDYIRVADNPTLRPVNLTIAGWFRFNTPTGPQLLVDKHLGSGSFDSYELWLEAGLLQGTVGNSGGFGPFIQFPFIPSPTLWYHLAYTFNDATNTQRLYINGAMVAQTAVNVSISCDAEPLLLGASNDFTTPNSFFNGTMDDVRIYSRDLTGGEINALFTAIVPLIQPTIATFSPPAGAVGSIVTIIGSNFTGPSTSVLINGVNAPIVDLQPTSIMVSVPPGATSGAIQVTVACNSAVSGSSFIVCTPPTPPGIIPGSLCGPGAVTLSATGAAAGQYRWYDGGILIPGEVNASYVTPVLSVTKGYEVSINNGVCESSRVFIVAIINAIPILPIAPDVPRCDPGTVTLVASGAGPLEEYRWYDLPAAGTLLSSVAPYTSPVITVTTNYYVSKIEPATGCEGSRRTVQAIVNTSPLPPGVISNSGCSGTSINLSASGAAPGQYRWYTVPSGGTSIVGVVNDTFATPPITTSTDFYVTINNGTCESSRTTVTATVLPLPTQPTITPASGCAPSASLILTAAGGAPGEYRWYTTATGGSPITGETNAVYSTPLLSLSTTYHVSINNGICESPRVSVLAEIRSCTPTIETATATTEIGSSTTIDIAPLVTTIIDPIDINSIKVTIQPLSGAVATITAGVLLVDYSGVSFAGTDHLTIEACDLAGHCAQQEITIEVTGEITVFNALSPNGDGKNDEFFIEHISSLPDTKENKLTIFNRWGSVVFEATNYDNTTKVFRGLGNNGAELPSGTYYYTLEFTKNAPKRTGFISLKR